MYQYLLGDDIFVAPFYQEGNDRTIIFPKGEWIYLFDQSKSYSGIKKLGFPLDEIPVFIRKGAVIPLDQADVNGLTIAMYPAKGTKQFGLYEENKPGAMLSYTKSGDALTITSTPTERPLLYRVHGEPAPGSITLDGKTLKEATSMKKCKSAMSGWYREDGVLWIAVNNARAGFEVHVKY